MVDAIAVEKLTLEEFVRLYDTEGAFEFIDGERKPLVPSVSGHSDMIRKLVFALYAFEQADSGFVFFETPFVLVDTPNGVTGSRVPDVMFYLKHRLDAYKTAHPEWKQKPLVLVPDLVVEVISEHDTYSQVERKTEAYLKDGVQLVWVIDPRNQRVTIHQAGSSQQTRLTIDDTLTGGDVLPDFAMPAAELFA